MALQSKWFWYGILVLFFIESAWIAVSGLYPMAFDEGTHLGTIQLYADKILPFWSSQPDGPATFGAVVRDPSYMYHYLLSFPYRLIEHFFQSQDSQIIIFRFINIFIFGFGLVLFRKVLLNTRASKALTHTVILLFILTPVVPFLAAQINYDNLLFLAVAATLLQTQRIIKILDKSGRIDILSLLQLSILLLLGSLVKYAFLPIFLGVVVYLGIRALKIIRPGASASVWAQTLNHTKSQSKVPLILAFCVLILSFGLFVERYGYNTIEYRTPTPECNQVLSDTACMNYGPWRRNFMLHEQKIAGTLPQTSTNPLSYAAHWTKWISNELFFTLNGSSTDFQTGQPLTHTRYISVGLIAVGIVLFTWHFRRIFKQYRIGLLLSILATYVLLLFSQNYMDFLHLGLPVAVQGRYLVPILLILYLFLALGFNATLRSYGYIKAALVWVATLFLLTQGGGAGIYIYRSDDSWFRHDQTVLQMNETARNIQKLFIIER